MAFVLKQPGAETAKETSSCSSAVLYGPPLVGKTTTMALDPAFKYLLIDLDKNTTTLHEADNVMIATCETFQDYLEVKEAVRRGYFMIDKQKVPIEVDCVVIDSFTTLEEKIKAYVLHYFAKDRSRQDKTAEPKFGAQSDWQDLQDIEVKEVREWQAMTKRVDNPVNVLWIGHDMTLTKEGTNIAVSTGIALQGKYAGPRIISAVDAVFYMFKAEKDGKLIRCIRTLSSGIILADARIPINRRAELPEIIANPKWSKIFGVMGYKK